MTDTETLSPTPMDEITVRLGDLGLAPENLRFQEPADDGVPQLAETVLAAGVLIPPIVRAGRKGEQAFMALDGRRRRFSLLVLRDRADRASHEGSRQIQRQQDGQRRRHRERHQHPERNPHIADPP